MNQIKSASFSHRCCYVYLCVFFYAARLSVSQARRLDAVRLRQFGERRTLQGILLTTEPLHIWDVLVGSAKKYTVLTGLDENVLFCPKLVSSSVTSVTNLCGDIFCVVEYCSCDV